MGQRVPKGHREFVELFLFHAFHSAVREQLNIEVLGQLFATRFATVRLIAGSLAELFGFDLQRDGEDCERRGSNARSMLCPCRYRGFFIACITSIPQSSITWSVHAVLVVAARVQTRCCFAKADV